MPPKAQSAADMPFDLKAVKLRPTVVADKDRPTPEDLALQELRVRVKRCAVKLTEELTLTFFFPLHPPLFGQPSREKLKRKQ